MFTSRAEYRLSLRIDNADERLTPIGRRAGLVDDQRWSAFLRKGAQKAALTASLENSKEGAWLKRPESRLCEIAEWVVAVLGEEPLAGVISTVETETKYAGYIAQQNRQVANLDKSAGRCIPAGFVFAGIPGLSREIGEKLGIVQPKTLGQAARIPGVTPAAVAILDVYLRLQHV